jgi:hypothetical protein
LSALQCKEVHAAAAYCFHSEHVYRLDHDAPGYMSEKCLASSVDASKPIGSWKVSGTAARKAAGVSCRWHDVVGRGFQLHYPVV